MEPTSLTLYLKVCLSSCASYVAANSTIIDILFSEIPDHLGNFRDRFLVWFYPLLFIVGLLGICSTLLTLHRHPRVVPKTTRLWLQVLLIVDMLVLSVIGLRWWIYVEFQRDVAATQHLLCMIYNYIIYCLVSENL